MIIDLVHNKIVADTITTAFEKSVEENLVPALVKKYGKTEIVGIQMYEDYLSDGFSKNGYWYYPLTVVTSDGAFTEWVKWAVNNDSFENGVPYAYVGEGGIDFKITESVPEEFENKLVGRARFCEDGLIKLKVETSASDITRLSGKYSQTFVDELARQITKAIGSAMSVEGLADSGLELSLVFAPGTYMEHISESVTYRRLVISDGSSAPRDFWIKWTRLDGAVAYSVASNVGAENIVFELGEDVSQKIREKEYRYLVGVGRDKYHTAMGRKNVTEWREIIKRAIRRGELVKIEQPVELAPETRELEEKLADVLGRAGVALPEKDAAPEVASAPALDDEFERAMQKMREMANAQTSDEEAAVPVIPEEEPEEEPEAVLEEDKTAYEAEEISPAIEEAESDEENAASENIVFDAADDAEDIADAAPALVEFFEEEEDEEPEEELDELEAFYAEGDSALDVSEGAVASNDDEAAELEEITRLALEALAEAKARAEAENASLDDAEPSDEETEDGEFLEFSDDESLEEEELADEADAEALAELRLLDPEDEAVEENEAAEESETCEAVDLSEICDEEANVDTAEEGVEIADEETIVSPEREQDIRDAIEAKIRLEYESRARKMAEEETERLRREQEKMRIENERLLEEARREQEKIRAEYEKLLSDTERLKNEREAKEAARRAEEERLRAQIEAQLRQEARERERLAEAARIAIEEQRRLEEENARRELERAAEEKRIEQERLQREAEARVVAARAAEAERIRREEEAARAAAAAAMPTVGDGTYSYTSKVVKLIFRKSVDPNITARIHEIIKATIEYYGKDKVFMKIRASVPDSQNVILEFVQIPIEEMELLGNIIKILGNSGLGIAKAIVE